MSEEAKRYLLTVEWSEEDKCYVGLIPGLVYGGCHGDDPRKVFAELCEIAEEIVELHRDDGEPLPPPTAGRDMDGVIRSAARDMANPENAVAHAA